MADAADAEATDGGGEGGGGGGGGGGEGAEGHAAEREVVADAPDFAVVCSFLHTFGALVQLEPIAVPKLARLLLNTHEGTFKVTLFTFDLPRTLDVSSVKMVVNKCGLFWIRACRTARGFAQKHLSLFGEGSQT